MKITRIETIPVYVPLKKGMTTRTAHGEHVVSPLVIVRVHTDEGLVGLGEATVAAKWSGETSQSCVAAIRDLIEPALKGEDPLQRTLLRKKMEFQIKLNPFTRAAVEMALWDLAGKAAGVPVYQLLGGKVRDAVPIKMMIGAFDLPRAQSLAEQFLKWGVKTLKVKTGLDPDGDVARVQAIREVAGPKIPITIDSNCGWNVTIAKQTLRRLREFNLLLSEQPIHPGDPAALAEVRRDTDIPIMADESVFTLRDAWLVSLHRAADIFSVYPGKHGGIAETLEIVNVAKAADLRCAIGSNLELGIGTAAMLHVAVAYPEIASEIYPADTIGPLYHETDLLTRPLTLGPAEARVPEGPGLGVELDEELLRRFRDDQS
ncbi:MAG TPA: enolase C-terminal domain-like protein [Gemmataceae bacterium]|nr:enolase C-terminal domain-like protein [Gemmataceae bacterium]